VASVTVVDVAPQIRLQRPPRAGRDLKSGRKHCHGGLSTNGWQGDPIRAPPDGRIILDPGEFYILASREKLHIPPDLAAEMVPIDPAMGEFRVHYAGFFDPGFGYTEHGHPGSRAVLEVRSHGLPFIIEDGQVIGRLEFERMAERPDVLYGQTELSNYQGQGLKLSKHFKAR